MKECSKCKKLKDESEFFFKCKEKNIHHSYCKDCKRELDKKIYSENKNDRKNKVRIAAKKKTDFLKRFVKRLKMLGRCKKCSDNRWYVLDFHHMKDKKDNIGALYHSGVSIDRLKQELRKCILLCSNCHREEHHLNRMAL